MRRFLDSLLYEPEAFLIDAIVCLDAESRSIEAQMDTTRALPFSGLQRPSEIHPAHVAAAEILMLTGNLGCLHACRWDEGWAGFGNRIQRADFKHLARIGPPMRLESRAG